MHGTQPISDPELRELAGYWQSLAGSGKPSCDDVEPSALAHVVDRVLIADHTVAEDGFRLSYVGDAIVTALGHDPTNEPIEVLAADPGRSALLSGLSQAIDGGTPAFLHSLPVKDVGGDQLLVDILLLPLWRAETGRAAVLGGVAYRVLLAAEEEEADAEDE